ncbi:MAG: DsbA family oxidoreductase [Bacteroidetes bacterium]|nr:DsbA family oxidoreductase [Bacteroidota bacterium]
MTKPFVKIDVISDLVCPWCYIGKRRLERAIDQLKDKIEVEVEYHPFELNADTPKEGVNHKEYLLNKFGSTERYEQIHNHVTKIALQEDIKFNFSDALVTPNTFDAHRLIAFAKLHNKQKEIKEALMSAFFEKNIDLTQNKNLVAIASDCGLNANDVEKFLASDDLSHQIREAEKLNYKRGISGVPFYIVNNKYGVSGAQPTETFVKLLTEVSAESLQGEVCDVAEKNC